jgi:hypothetical protein
MYSTLKPNRIALKTWMLLMLYVFTTLNIGCKKLVETDAPTTSISGKNVFSTDATSIAVLTGIYTKISGSSIMAGGYGSEFASIGFLTGLSGDELTLYEGVEDTRLNYYQNRIIARTDNYSFWNVIYPKIYILNSAIEGISDSQSLNNTVKKQLLGEAKFMRAFCYFYLVNLYGNVPLVVNSDYTINLALPRTPKDQVWNQIILDLKDAQNLLSDNYLDITLLKKTTERVRPTKWVATALLARSYLFLRDWKNAELQSSLIINHSDLYHLEGLNEVFKNTSSEAIWQLQPVNLGFNTEDARCYIISDYGPGADQNGAAYISGELLKSFDVKDQRAKNWIDRITYEGFTYYYPYKYKIGTYDEKIVSPAEMNEYQTVFRLAEQYLIKAEALSEQGNLSDAVDNLDVIRNRAGLDRLKITNPGIAITDLRSAILEERRHELFTEWGHRWLDLKRTNTIDKIMSEISPLKGGTWNTNWQLYPVPPEDIRHNQNLIQNPGY